MLVTNVHYTANEIISTIVGVVIVNERLLLLGIKYIYIIGPGPFKTQINK